MQRILDPAFKEFLVGDSDLDWVSLRAVFLEPIADEGHVASASGATRPLVERTGRPVQLDTVCSILSIKRLLREDWLDYFREGELI